MVPYVLGYLLIGVLVMIWFLVDMARAKQRIDNGDGTTSDRRVIKLMQPAMLTGILLFLITLWPLAVIMYIRADDDNSDDPQNRVPPEYR